MVTVRVHPSFAIPYYSFYLEGLGRVFGHSCISFAKNPALEKTEFDDGFGFTIESPDLTQPPHRRIYVSANDFVRYDRVALDWCDRYGMINHDSAVARQQPGHEKVVPVGSSFGLREWGSVRRTACDLVELHKFGGFSKGAYDRLRASRKQLFDRLPERRYVPGRSSRDYVFFVSWPWKKHPDVNPPRARFMRACKSIPGLRFEGGFPPRRRRDVPDIDDVLAERMYSFREWVTRTQASCVVFNCPAVHRCLGWKLGEFLALGKAIISLPLSREMPAPLVHGEHVHYVEDDQLAMKDAIERISKDDAYRTRLEIGAREYYLEHLAPERVIRRLVFGE